MRVLLTGQCTLHIGRMEFGNIGNYYIIEPFIRELHRCFPGVDIRTTFQMSDEFCQREKVSRLPMDLYYGWSKTDLPNALLEVGIAETFRKTGELLHTTPYIAEVIASDLVIDFSGDIWGDNANLLGENRFFIGLCKDYVAQLLGKRTVMLAGSPGPFTDERTKIFAKEVFANFDLVTNREKKSRLILENEGFRTDHVVDLACPAFLFEPIGEAEAKILLHREGLIKNDKPLVGFIICGWNFAKGPFDRWPRDDDEYLPFAQAIEHVSNRLNARICLLSHSNGFDLPAPPFKLIHGRDYQVIKQLQKVVELRGFAKDVIALDRIYSTWETKAIIGHFDMVISGRVHAAVAALSQNVPTVVIDYGHEPKAHKLSGFAEIAGVENFVADPSNANDLINKIDQCWRLKQEIRNNLIEHISQVKNSARRNFDLLLDMERK